MIEQSVLFERWSGRRRVRIVPVDIDREMVAWTTEDAMVCLEKIEADRRTAFADLLKDAFLIAMGFWRRTDGFWKHAYLANVILMSLGFILTGYQLVGFFVV